MRSTLMPRMYPVAEICMLKNQATQTMAFCASEAVQIFGGAGYMRGIKVERIYREVKVNAIGGGSEEIMKDPASRQMGLGWKAKALPQPPLSPRAGRGGALPLPRPIAIKCRGNFDMLFPAEHDDARRALQ